MATGNSRSATKQKRLQEVTKFCAETPRTIEEISKEFGTVYNTAWRYVDTLISMGYLKNTNRLKDGAALFIAGKPKTIPEIYNKFTDEYYSPLDFLPGFIKEPNATLTSEQVCHDLPANIAQVLWFLQTEDTAGLGRMRVKFEQSILLLESTASMYRQIEMNNDFWTLEGARKMVTSNEWDRDLVNSANVVNNIIQRNIPECYYNPVGTNSNEVESSTGISDTAGDNNTPG